MKQKRIKVLYTIPNFNTSGSGKSVYDLVKGLDKTIFEPEVCCFHNKGPFFKEVEALGCKIHLFQFTAPTKPRLKFVSKVFKIRAFFKTNNFDVIHSWHWSSDFSEPLAARLAGVPYVYTKKAMGWKSKHWKIRSKLSTKIVVVNRDMTGAYFKGMLSKIRKYPLAIDINKYMPYEASSELKLKLGFEIDDFIIISVANMVEVKGIEILFKAVQILKHPKIKVLIVGDTSSDYGTYLKSEYKNRRDIKFVGKQLDVRPYLALSDLFVIPTKDKGRREGIPNAPLEAMAMNRIVIGSKISGIKDILETFPELLFEAENSKELANKIKRVFNMPKKKKKDLELEMRKRVVEGFAIEGFIKFHESLYHELT